MHFIKINKKWLLVFINLNFCMFLTTCNPQTKTDQSIDDTFSKIKTTGIIKVGYVVWPPTVIKDPNTGKLSGHFIDAIEYIAKEIKAQIQYYEVTWNTFEAGLEAKQYDVSIAGTYITIPRAKSVTFTRPLFYLGNSAVIRKEEIKFQNLNDFNNENVTLSVTQGTGEHEYALNYLNKANIKAFSSPDLTLPLLEVLNKRSDVAFTDTYTATQFVKKNPSLQALFVDHPFNLSAVSWSVRSGDQSWLDFLNSSLTYLELSGRLKEFELKYDATWLHTKLIWE